MLPNFDPFGILGWPRLSVLLVLLPVTVVVSMAIAGILNPGLLRERFKRRKNTKWFDRIFIVLFVPATYALVVVGIGYGGMSALASSSPGPLFSGLALHIIGACLLTSALVVNPHAEVTVRIQTDRGHKVITNGPYRIVRHPMYAGGLIMFMGWPLIMGSYMAYIPVGAILILYVFRTAFEDRMLRNELPGYENYAHRTRYRLVPYVW
jgi:protein-S-isoprenylcysteine O-methyltransferase Ste14